MKSRTNGGRFFPKYSKPCEVDDFLKVMERRRTSRDTVYPYHVRISEEINAEQKIAAAGYPVDVYQQWCDENCEGIALYESQTQWYFSRKRDATLFRLFFG